MDPATQPAADPTPSPATDGSGAAGTPFDGAGVVESARRLLDEGGDAARSALETARALKTLAGAELALAKAAVVRAAVLAVGATLFALIGVFFVFATLSALLVALGLGWAAALGISTLLLLAGAGLLAWRAVALTRLARFDATRRQLALLREHQA
jgi:uncharacterized membrane protein YqjE